MDDSKTEMSARIIPARGGWMALSQPGAPFPIGVLGTTEEEARRLFDAAVEAWRKLRAARLDSIRS